MSHLDEGTLLAIRDRGIVDADARTHVVECGECSEALAATRDRAEMVARALGALDEGPVIDVEAGKGAVRRRLDERRGAPRRPAPPFYRSLGRAAALVLLASGAVYALPNSPLRHWIIGDGTPPAATVEAGPAVDASEGIELAVPAGGLTIVLNAAQTGQRIEVAWVDGDEAAVVAGAGSRYAVSSGSLRVDVAAGDVHIDVPLGSDPVTIEVNGRLLLRASAGEMDVRGAVASRDARGIVFTVETG